MNLKFNLNIIFLLVEALVIIVFLIIFGIKANLEFFDEVAFRNYSLVIAQILTTIFAITLSITLIGLQYLSDNVSPKRVKNFLLNRFVFGMIISYTFSILFALITPYFENSLVKYFMPFNILLFIWCFFYLISYLIFYTEYTQIEKEIDEISKEIPDDYYNIILENKFRDGYIKTSNPDIFNVVESILYKSLVNKSYSDFHRALKLIIDKHMHFLETMKKEQEVDPDRLILIDRYFEFIYRRIGSEILNANNNMFTLGFLLEITNLMENQISEENYKNYILEAQFYNDMGKNILKKDYDNYQIVLYLTIFGEHLVHIMSLIKDNEFDVDREMCNLVDFSVSNNIQDSKFVAQSYFLKYFYALITDNKVKNKAFRMNVLLLKYENIFSTSLEPELVINYFGKKNLLEILNILEDNNERNLGDIITYSYSRLFNLRHFNKIAYYNHVLSQIDLILNQYPETASMLIHYMNLNFSTTFRIEHRVNLLAFYSKLNELRMKIPHNNVRYSQILGNLNHMIDFLNRIISSQRL